MPEAPKRFTTPWAHFMAGALSQATDSYVRQRQEQAEAVRKESDDLAVEIVESFEKGVLMPRPTEDIFEKKP
jgi:hypothetical protein